MYEIDFCPQENDPQKLKITSVTPGFFRKWIKIWDFTLKKAIMLVLDLLPLTGRDKKISRAAADRSFKRSMSIPHKGWAHSQFLCIDNGVF